MEVSTKKLESDLNNLFKTNPTKYADKLNDIKNMGYKVYRNSDGDHKIKQNENFIYEAFGGVFGQIFNK